MPQQVRTRGAVRGREATGALSLWFKRNMAPWGAMFRFSYLPLSG
uniref:Uncharacterized protein n=1 Tax=Ectopseudomonas oleovorans TaxID=301 RepID=A0A653BD16_ECTOL